MTYVAFCQSKKGQTILEYLGDKFNGETTLHELILRVCWSAMEYDPSRDSALLARQAGIDSRPHKDKIKSHSKKVLEVRDFVEQNPDMCKQALCHAIAEAKGNAGMIRELEIHRMVEDNFELINTILEKYSEIIVPPPAPPPQPKGTLPDKIVGYGVPFEVAGLLFRAPGGRLDKQWVKIGEQALFFRLIYIFRHYSKGKLDEICFEDQPMPEVGNSYYEYTEVIASLLYGMDKKIDSSAIRKMIDAMIVDHVKLVTLEFPLPEKK